MLKNIVQNIRHDIARPVVMRFFRLFPGLGQRFRLHRELASIRQEADRYFAEGKTLPENSSREDYYQAMNTHLVSISEYLYQYEFYKLTESEREEFISRAMMRGLAMKLFLKFPKDSHGLSIYKNVNLADFSRKGLCHRRWLYSLERSEEHTSELQSLY